MYRLLAVGICLLALLASASAQQKLDVRRMTKAEAAAAYQTYAIMLAALMNCEKVNLSKKDTDRLANFGTVLNRKLAMSTDQTEEYFYGPAFHAVNSDNSGFCAQYAPLVANYAKRIR
jgi:alpha-L-arabinofuranosidase